MVAVRKVNSGHVQFTVTVNSDRNRQLFIIRCFGQLNVVNPRHDVGRLLRPSLFSLFLVNGRYTCIYPEVMYILVIYIFHISYFIQKFETF